MASFIGGGNRSTQKKTTVRPQVTDKLYHITLYRVHTVMSGIQTNIMLCVKKSHKSMCEKIP